MRDVSSSIRALSVTVLSLAVLGASGCKFRKDDALYVGPPESRPLEVPPDLDRPRTEGAIALPQAALPSATSSAAAQDNGFTVADEHAAVFERIAQALALVSDLTIINQAELLGTFEVEYDDERFLVRVTSSGDSSTVSAVDARGEPATGPAAQRLITELKAAMSP